MYVADISPQAPKELLGEQNCHLTLNCDVRSRKDTQSFLDSITGRLDGLVNSAGVGAWEGKIGADELYQRTMDINVTGTWNMVTEAMRRMSTQDDTEAPGVIPGAVRSVGQGSIVVVGSGASRRGVGGMAAYTASKHAVLGLTRSWARDFPKLRVNCVAPSKCSHISLCDLLLTKVGATDTPLVEAIIAGAPKDDPTVAVGKAQVALIPKGRMAYPTDVADVIIFLLSDWSSFITGQCLPVNGGNS